MSALQNMPRSSTFPVNATIQTFVYERAADLWALTFSGAIALTIYSAWRLRRQDRILAASTDHQHGFGLSAPAVLAAETLSRLRHQPLVRVEIRNDTGDLRLVFADGQVLEVPVTPMHYECYDLTLNGERFIATGGGI